MRYEERFFPPSKVLTLLEIQNSIILFSPDKIRARHVDARGANEDFSHFLKASRCFRKDLWTAATNQPCRNLRNRELEYAGYLFGRKDQLQVATKRRGMGRKHRRQSEGKNSRFRKANSPGGLDGWFASKQRRKQKNRCQLCRNGPIPVLAVPNRNSGQFLRRNDQGGGQAGT
eukprot:jgi/Bigna1/136571/aug1.34_g11279